MTFLEKLPKRTKESGDLNFYIEISAILINRHALYCVGLSRTGILSDVIFLEMDDIKISADTTTNNFFCRTVLQETKTICVNSFKKALELSVYHYNLHKTS